jgi:hypothetical protein
MKHISYYIDNLDDFGEFPSDELSAVHPRLAKRLNLFIRVFHSSVLYFSIKIQSITKNDACFLLFSVFPLLNYSKISER